MYGFPSFFFFIVYIVWNIDIIKSYRLNLNDSNDERSKLYSDSNRIYYDSMRFTSFSLFFFSSFAREKTFQLHYACREPKSVAYILFIHGQTVSNKSEVSANVVFLFFHPPFQEAPSSHLAGRSLSSSHNLNVEDEDSKGTIVPWEGYGIGEEGEDGGGRRMNL